MAVSIKIGSETSLIHEFLIVILHSQYDCSEFPLDQKPLGLWSDLPLLFNAVMEVKCSCGCRSAFRYRPEK